MTRSVTITELNALAALTKQRYDGVEMFRAMPTQVPFFKSQASEILLRGGNRSGKSTCAALKFAAIARQKPILGPNGEPIEQRLPWQVGRPLIMWIIGLKLDHIGQTIYRLLFKSGLYKTIRDKATGEWRAFRPWEKADAERELECKPSPPLIPFSELDGGFEHGFEWENKAGRKFNSFRMKNGTEVFAYPSSAVEAKQGDPVDLIWIDERIMNVEHYEEWQARLSDRKGRIVWSSKPHPSTSMLTERAADQAEEIDSGERETADVEDFVLKFSANPYIDEDEKRKRREGWSDEAWAVRSEGEYDDEDKLYPHFSRKIHCAIPDDPDLDDELAAILRKRNGEPPEDWTRELILDPGTARPGVLLCAVPPPQFWKNDEPFFVPYDEIYRSRRHAWQIAEEVKKRTLGQWFERFIIDGKAGQQTPMGFALTVSSNYSIPFKELGLSSRQTGSSFIPGDPNWGARSQKVEAWMRFRRNAPPQLRIVIARCPNLVWQMENNVKAKEGNLVIDKPAKRQKDDLRNCLEYWASRDPQYVEPPAEAPSDPGPCYRDFLRLERLFGGRDPDDNHVHCGPGPIRRVSA